MKFKTFGIYTLNNNLYIIMGYENNSIVGFKSKINELLLSNENINDLIMRNNNILKFKLFKIYDPHILFSNAAYLGQVNNANQIPLTYNYARLIMEEINYD